MRVLAFIGFLVAYAAWMWANHFLMKRMETVVRERQLLWIGQLVAAVNVVGLFLFLVILAGYFNWRLAAALFLASEVAVLLSSLLRVIVARGPESVWPAVTRFTGIEAVIKHPAMTKSVVIIAALVGLAYPIAVGIDYFRLPSTEVAERIFLYTFGVLTLGGLPVIGFSAANALLSPNINEDLRLQTFVGQVASLIPNVLWLALALWALGIGRGGVQFGFGAVWLNISPVVFWTIGGFFLVTVAVPYLTGAQRSHHRRTGLLKRRQDWYSRLDNVLDSPVADEYVPELTGLEQDLDKEITEFVQNDRLVTMADEIDAASPSEDEIDRDPALTPSVRAFIKSFIPCYRMARPHDLRFTHLDALREFAKKISAIRSDLSTEETEAELEKTARKWARYFKPRREEFAKEVAEAEKTRTPAMLLYSGVAVPILVALLSQLTESVWGRFVQTAP